MHVLVHVHVVFYLSLLKLFNKLSHRKSILAHLILLRFGIRDRLLQMASENFVQATIPRFDGHYDHWSMLKENFLRSKEYWQNH